VHHNIYTILMYHCCILIFVLWKIFSKYVSIGLQMVVLMLDYLGFAKIYSYSCLYS
jgi:hypothetical protein